MSSRKPPPREARTAKAAHAVTMDLVIDDVATTGEGVAHTADREAVFVPGTLDGERVRAAVAGGRPRRARLLEVLEPSPRRVEPVCEHATRCGGCDFMHLSADAQAEWHVRHVVRVLEPIVARRGVGLPSPVFHAARQALGYRTRARFHVRAFGRRVEVGYRPPRSHDLVDIERCVVLSPGLAPVLGELRALLASSRGEGEVSVALGAGGRPVLDVRFSGVLADAYFAGVERGCIEGRLAGARTWLEGAREPLVAGDPRPVVLSADGALLQVAAGGFAQASDDAGAALASRVAELASETRAERAIELFAGSGTLTVALARVVGELTAIEREEPAVAALRENLRARALSVKVRVGDADALPLPKVDLVVLDPPRAGAPGAVAAIAAARPKHVVYVSCNVATLARDLEPLLAARYRPRALDLFDLFPQTSHVEAVMALTR